MNNKNKGSPLDVPKMPVKTSPLGGLGNPLGGAKKNGNEKSLVPPMPSMNK